MCRDRVCGVSRRALLVGGLAAMVPVSGVRADVVEGGRQVVRTFSGRASLGFDQWAYVPFEVPEGVRRISVRRTYEPFVVVPGVLANVLDIGIFDPDGWDVGNESGFRGWSGGARESFTISASDATPGYVAGVIQAGTWAVALGPIVYKAGGMPWTVEVTLEFGADGEPFRAVPAPSRADGRGEGWYRGDMHLHTVYSDGQRTLDEMAAAAQVAGLDFIASTEHNTRSANQVWGNHVPDGLLVIAGEEVTTRHGHWLALGLPAERWVDWRYAPRDGTFGSYAQKVHAAGGLVIAAHPVVPGPGSVWGFGYDHVDGVEVWNGPWTLDDQAAVVLWDRLLRDGRRLPALGNSDSHAHTDVVGHPHTVVHAPDLTRQAILAAVKAGRSYLAESAQVTVDLKANGAGLGETADASNGIVRVDATVHGRSPRQSHRLHGRGPRRDGPHTGERAPHLHLAGPGRPVRPAGGSQVPARQHHPHHDGRPDQSHLDRGVSRIAWLENLPAS